MRVPYFATSDQSELIAALAVLAILVSTAIMFGRLLLVARRWKLPFGTDTIVLLLVNLGIALGFDDDLLAIPVVLVAGLLFDWLASRNVLSWLLATLPTATLWVGCFITVGATGNGLGLAPEIWGGAILFAVLTILALDRMMQLVSPPAISESHGQAVSRRTAI